MSKASKRGETEGNHRLEKYESSCGTRLGIRCGGNTVDLRAMPAAGFTGPLLGMACKKL
jgi:hypothetical protein